MGPGERSSKMPDAQHQPNFRSPAAQSQEAHAASRRLFERSPLALLTLTPDLRIVDANNAYLRVVGRRRETITNLPLFDAFPDNPHDPKPTGVRDLSASLQRVLLSGTFDLMPFLRYDIQPETGPWEVRYWHPKNWPILDEKGSVVALVHNAVDVTENMFELYPELRRGPAPIDKSHIFHEVTDQTNAGQFLRRSRMQASFNSELVTFSRNRIAQSLELLNRSQLVKLLSDRAADATRHEPVMISELLQELALDPEEIVMLTECYEAILGELGLTSQTDLMTEVVAQHVIATARSGERDPARLREQVLASFRT